MYYILLCVLIFQSRAGVVFFFFFKQKTAYEIGTGDWSSDVCSSDLKHDPLADEIPVFAIFEANAEQELQEDAADMVDEDRKSVV